MRIRRFALFALAVSLLPAAFARPWTSRTGKTVEAEFGGYEDGQVVLKLADDQVGRIQLESLTEDDQVAALQAYERAASPVTVGGVSLVIPAGFTAVKTEEKAPVSVYTFSGSRRPEGTACSLVVSIFDTARAGGMAPGKELYMNAVTNGRKTGLEQWKETSGEIVTAYLDKLPIVTWTARRRGADIDAPGARANGFIGFYLHGTAYVTVMAQDTGVASEQVEACKDALRTLKPQQ